MKKLLSLVLVLVLLASLVTACGSKQETAQTTTTPTEQKTEATQKPEEKQEAVSQAAPAPASTEIKRLKYSRGGDVTSFDLFNTSFIAPMIVTKCIQDTLVFQNNNGEFSPYVATKWESNADGTEWTFWLRDDVKFSDGTPMTAKDVKASYEYPLKNSVQASSTFASLKEVQIIDDYTVKFVYSVPCGTILFDLWNYPMTSAANVEKGVDTMATAPIGSGPYKIKEWNPGKNVIMDRNEYWWGDPCYYDEIEFDYIAEIATRAAAVQTGDLDICEGVTPELKTSLEADPNLYLFDIICCDNLFLAFRCDEPPFDNQLLRQAASYAINREALIKLFGVGNAAKCLLPSSCLGHNANLTLGYDLEKAKALVAESGYNGTPAKLIVNFGILSKTKELSEMIQNMLGQAGINIEIYSYDSAGLVAARTAGDFNIQLNTCAHLGYEPNVFLQRFVSDVSNLHYKNDTVLALIEEGRTGTTIEARQATYEKLMELLQEEMPYVPLFEYSLTYAVSNKVSKDGLEQGLRNDKIPYLRVIKGVG